MGVLSLAPNRWVRVVVSTLTILSTTNEAFAALHVKSYVNVLITQRVSIFENLVIGSFSAANGAAVWTYRAEEPLIEKVEYVNMRPTIAGLGAGCISAWAHIYAIHTS
ncbi:hypothetical protein DW645_06595 [Collinsella sp. AM23-17]|nr:hypothetical protein DW645_06595 [Collinsella sp. AM23-17]